MISTATPATDPTAIGPGLLGFLVVAAIGVALFFLIKSMNRQIAKIEVPHEGNPKSD
ncbi:hypothetical protein [Herbidospora sp. RD11066]